MTEAAQSIVYGSDRDAGKTFYVGEVRPLEMSGFMLRLAAALRVPSYESLIDDILALRAALPAAAKAGAKKAAQSESDAGMTAGVALNVIMQILQRCDAHALHALIKDALTYVTISPDPKHPDARRALLSDDILEKRTLSDILVAFAKTNAWSGA